MMATFSGLLSLSLCLVLLGTCLAQQNECQFDKLESLKPDHVIRSEAGRIETWNPNHKQFRCAGVALSRCTLQRHALRLPSYSNAPQLFFIRKGSGVFGLVFSGCADTYEEPQQSGSRRSSRSPDRHQKIHHFKEGDVIAVPAGVAFWIYNHEQNPVEAISILDTNSYHNQLDKIPRRFYLAGNQEQEFLKYQQEQQQQQKGGGGEKKQQRSRREGQEEEQEEEGTNIFSGFDEEFLAQAFNVDTDTVRKLQGLRDDREGGIVKVEGGLSIMTPPSRKTQQEQEQEKEKEQEEEEEEQSRQRPKERRRRGGGEQSGNGLEETLCTLRLSQNIGKSTAPDVYNPQAGSLRTVNSLDLPVLDWIKLSAEFGTLHENALFVPHYNLNAHSIIFALKGRARVQVVDCSGNTVFDKELEEGQALTVPQNFAVAAKSQSEPFLYVAFKTSENAIMAPLAGRTSVIRAWPEEVVAQAFQLRREQARQVKNNNPYTFLVPPTQSQHSQSEMRAVA